MKELSEPSRWTSADAELPSELQQMLRASRDQLGTTGEVAELARRLAQALGPASGLDGVERIAEGSRGSSDVLPPKASSGALQHRAAAAGMRLVQGHTLRLGPWGIWALAGAGALAALAYWMNSTPSPLPPVPVLAAPEPEARPALAEPPPKALERESSAVTPPAPLPTDLPQRTIAQPSKRRPDEAALLERAREELALHPARALQLAREHQTRFPRGLLAEEREVIAISALERLGRTRAAAERSRDFERRYRGSVHRPRLNSADVPEAPR